jgi:hypothetical protein
VCAVADAAPTLAILILRRGAQPLFLHLIHYRVSELRVVDAKRFSLLVRRPAKRADAVPE